MLGRQLVLVTVCLLLLKSPAWAADAESPEYRQLVEQALSEYGGKNYDEASTLFARAHQLYPNARTLRGLGMAAFELRRYPESVSYLESALSSTVRPLDPPLRQETEALLSRARGFVATVTVDAQPAKAELWLDGARVEAFAPQRVSLGEHVFELRQVGYISERRVVRLRGGEVLQLSLSLATDAVARATTSPSGQRSDKARPLYKNPWLWSGIGVAVAGAVTASVLLATRGHDRTNTVAQGTQNTPPGVSLSTLGVR